MALTSTPNWTEIVREHGSLVLRLCSRSTHDPEDAYQEAWARVFRHYHRYDPERGTLKGWIGTLTRHYLVDRFRRERSRGQVIPLVEQQVVSDACPEREVRDRLQRERLEAAIQRLPPDQRHVVLMHHLHGIPLAQLASEAGVALGTIKSRLHRGRAGLTAASSPTIPGSVGRVGARSGGPPATPAPRSGPGRGGAGILGHRDRWHGVGRRKDADRRGRSPPPGVRGR